MSKLPYICIYLHIYVTGLDVWGTRDQFTLYKNDTLCLDKVIKEGNITIKYDNHRQIAIELCRHFTNIAFILRKTATGTQLFTHLPVKMMSAFVELKDSP